MDLNEVSKKMGREFSKEGLTMPKNDREFSFFKEIRERANNDFNL